MKPKLSKRTKVQDSHDRYAREHVVSLLEGGNAHVKFDDVVAGLPAKLRGKKPDGYPHTAWMLLEHLRIAQWDILEFSRNSRHASPSWPDGSRKGASCRFVLRSPAASVFRGRRPRSTNVAGS